MYWGAPFHGCLWRLVGCLVLLEASMYWGAPFHGCLWTLVGWFRFWRRPPCIGEPHRWARLRGRGLPLNRYPATQRRGTPAHAAPTPILEKQTRKHRYQPALKKARSPGGDCPFPRMPVDTGGVVPVLAETTTCWVAPFHGCLWTLMGCSGSGGGLHVLRSPFPRMPVETSGMILVLRHGCADGQEWPVATRPTAHRHHSGQPARGQRA